MNFETWLNVAFVIIKMTVPIFIRWTPRNLRISRQSCEYDVSSVVVCAMMKSNIRRWTQICFEKVSRGSNVKLRITTSSSNDSVSQLAFHVTKDGALKLCYGKKARGRSLEQVVLEKIMGQGFCYPMNFINSSVTST